MSTPPSSCTERSTIARQWPAVLEIARQLERGPAGFAHDARGLVGVALLGFEVGDRDVGALAGERERDGAADARVTARHERLAAFELARAAVGRLAEVRRAAHVTLEPRVRELIGG